MLYYPIYYPTWQMTLDTYVLSIRKEGLVALFNYLYSTKSAFLLIA